MNTVTSGIYTIYLKAFQGGDIVLVYIHLKPNSENKHTPKKGRTEKERKKNNWDDGNFTLQSK